MDQAAVLKELKVTLGLPWEKLAQRLGLTKQRVLDLVGLLDLPDEIKDDIRHKKLKGKHGRALRQLLDKAEVLRDVFSFIKDKKLTGEQTQELVQSIKSEPRFTIEVCFKELTQRTHIRQKPEPKTSSLELVAAESKHLSKTLDKVLVTKLSQPERKILKESLLDIQKKISRLLDEMKN